MSVDCLDVVVILGLRGKGRAMSQSKVFLRADHVGSLLRPSTVTAARKLRYEEGAISGAELREAEDAVIPSQIAKQEANGLKAVTDGEAQRSFWHYDFMGALAGVELEERDDGVQFAGVKLPPIFPTIKEK